MYTHYLEITAADPIGLCGEFCELCTDVRASVTCPKCLERLHVETTKYIYFPNNFQGKAPKMIYVVDRWGNEWKGSEILTEVEEGRYQFYPIHRCQPYTQELWDACMTWVVRRDLVESEYRGLMKRGVPRDEN